MTEFLTLFNNVSAAVNGVLWHTAVLYILMGLGVLFTCWSGFTQYRSLTHGVGIVLGKYDREGGAGAISHFQALSAALSATVGVGNIGGVALGIALGGPGAVFWMWVVGFLGMALKTVEVTLSMLYRDTRDPENPSGGPMWVVRQGLAAHGPGLAKLGKLIGGFFCVTLLISTFTGGMFFQAWNAATVTSASFGVPMMAVGLVLAVLVGLVVLGGIARIGQVAGKIVPFMCGSYLIAALYVLIVKAGQLPGVFELILQGAFDQVDASGAFIGGTAGWAFSSGLQRAFFSNEAGQGSSPIAHAAARTHEPVREGLVAGLEPFIDTLVVCTLTAMVILSSGSWQRPADFSLEKPLVFERVASERWQAEPSILPASSGSWREGDTVFAQVSAHPNPQTGNELHQLTGQVALVDGQARVSWAPLASPQEPKSVAAEGFRTYTGAALTALSFDMVQPGLGRWLVTLATWLFALSTMISWCYYGEQGVRYLVGARGVTAYKLVFCASILLSTAGLIRGTTELNNLTMLGTGAMLFVNVPIMLLFSAKAIHAQRRYFAARR